MLNESEDEQKKNKHSCRKLIKVKIEKKQRKEKLNMAKQITLNARR